MNTMPPQRLPQRPARRLGAVGLILAMATVAPRALAADGELFYGPGGVANLRAKANQSAQPAHGPAPATVIADLLARAASFRQTTYSYSHGSRDFSYTLSAEAPASHSDYYPYWTAMFQERADSLTTRINTLTFAYLIEQSADDLAAALDIVLKLARWSTPSWSDPNYGCLPGPACLDTGHAAMSVAFFYDAARSALTPIQRSTIRTALIDKGLLPLKRAAEHCLTEPAHNGHAIVATGLAVGAAALYTEDSRAPAWLDLAIDLTNGYLSKQGEDGGALEYHGYAAYAMDYLVRVLAVAKLRGQPIESPYVDNLSQFFAAALAPDGRGVGTFGDSWAVCGGPTHHYLAAQGDALAQAYLVQSGLIDQQDFLTVGWVDGNRPFNPLPLAPWGAPSVGLGALRSVPDESATLVVFKAGPVADQVGHNQHDHLSFQIWAHGNWLMGDPGYSHPSSQAAPLFEFADGPLGHSTILLDHEGPILKEGAALTRVTGGTGFGLLCGEAAATYRQPLPDSVQRCLLLHPSGFVSLFDRVTSPHPLTLQWLFQPSRLGFARVVEGAVGDPPAADLVAPPGRLAIRPVGDGITAELADLARDATWPQTLVLSGPTPKGTPIPLADPGFEAATFGTWRPRGGAMASAHSLDGTMAHAGQQAAKIALGRVESGYYYSERFAVSPGDRINASAYVRTSEVKGSGARLRLLFWADGDYHADAESHPIKGDWPWHQRFVSGTVPAGVDQCALALELSTSTGEVWFDDASIARLAPAAAVPSSSRLTALLQPTATPWLVNGDFGLGLASWTPRAIAGAAHQVVTSSYRSAPHSARIAFADAKEAGYYYSAFIPVSPGDAIEVSAWLRAEVTAAPGARLRILYYHKGDYADLDRRAAYLTSAASWTQQQLADLVPAGVDQLRIALEFHGRGTAWFDDVAFRNSTRTIVAEDLAAPEDIRGDSTAFTFTRNALSYLSLCAADGPLDTPTALGQAQLDQGYAIYAAQRTEPTVLVEASQLTVADGISIALDRAANLRLERRGNALWAELTAGVSGQLPTRAVIEMEDAAGIVATSVNEQPTAFLSLPGDRLRVCWGATPTDLCRAVGDASVPPPRDAGLDLADASSTESPDGSPGCACSTATRPPALLPLSYGAFLLSIWGWRRRRSQHVGRTSSATVAFGSVATATQDRRPRCWYYRRASARGIHRSATRRSTIRRSANHSAGGGNS